MPNSRLTRQTGRITFLLCSLLVAGVCGVALKLLHSHPDSRRVTYAVGYGVILLGVFWTRSLESRLRDAGLQRWSFWPYFLIVFTGCLAAHVLKLTNSLQTLALFLVLQLPAALFSSKHAPSESLSPGASAEEASKSAALNRSKAARRITPIGAIEFAVYLLLIAGLLGVLHLLRGDVAGMAMARAWRFALDAGSGLVCVLWVFSVRGRLRSLGLTHWYLGFCLVVLALCTATFVPRFFSFQRELILFVVLQIPLVILRRQFIPKKFVSVDESEAADSDS